MLRRLAQHQPESFAFTPANQAWAEAQITKYPEGRQASAIIPLLWRAQEQEGWLTRPAIEHVAGMLGMAFIRALEVATFYFMFQLRPVGTVAHIQICGTTPCMLCGAEELVAVCARRISPAPHGLSADGRFSWEEVECLGACANAPMAQIGKDYYEDLTGEKLEGLLDEFGAGRVPAPGPQNGRFASEPLSGATSLKGPQDEDANASVALALALGDTVKRIDGTEVELVTPCLVSRGDEKPAVARRADGKPVSDKLGRAPAPKAPAPKPEVPEAGEVAKPEAGRDASAGVRPATLDTAREGGPDDLKRIKGIGPKLEALLHSLGFLHYDQIAAWTESELTWVDSNLEGFRGRASRDDWVGQAKVLAAEGGIEPSARKSEG